LEEVSDLCGVAVQVVRREHPQRHDLDADLLGPLQELRDVVGSPAMSRGRGLPERTRPAAVAVHHDAHVPRNGPASKTGDQPALVEPIERVRQAQGRSFAGRGRARAPTYRPRAARITRPCGRFSQIPRSYASVTYGCVGYAFRVANLASPSRCTPMEPA